MKFETPRTLGSIDRAVDPGDRLARPHNVAQAVLSHVGRKLEYQALHHVPLHRLEVNAISRTQQTHHRHCGLPETQLDWSADQPHDDFIH